MLLHIGLSGYTLNLVNLVNKSTTGEVKGVKRTTLMRVHSNVHREMAIASGHRNEKMIDLVSRSWDAFKVSEGRRLHKPQTGGPA